MNTVYPNSKAHSVQITKMLFSLSQKTKVTFICNGFSVNESNLIEEIERLYGLDLSTIKFMAIPKAKLTGLSFFLTLKKIVKITEKHSVFYTRSYNLAKRLARTKLFHKKIVILESHKKSGYYKEDKVKNSIYIKQRRQIEAKNKNIKVLKNIYKSVDGIVFTSDESKNIASQDLNLKHTTYVWYPLIHQPRTKMPDKHIVYAGSLGRGKLIDVLLDALALAPSNIVVDLIGGASEDIFRVRNEANHLGVSANIRFLDKVAAKDLPQILGQYTFGLSLMEGLKVTDYVECGLTPIIPRIPMYEEIFNDHNAIFFEADSAHSLRKKLDMLDTFDASHVNNLDLVERFSTSNTAQKILKLIEECANKPNSGRV
jgi:glycosyltransferase involved in cell wall biosynthesis